MSAILLWHPTCLFLVQVNRDLRRKVQVNRIRTATIAALLASFVGLQPAAAMAQDRDRRDRYEDRWDRHEDREIARKTDGIVVRIDGTAVTIATMRAATTGMRRDITAATIAAMVQDGLAGTTASTAVRTAATTAAATTVPQA